MVQEDIKKKNTINLTIAMKKETKTHKSLSSESAL